MSKMPDPYTGFIAGGLAGGIAAVATSPLEVLKTRLQSNVGQEVIRSRVFVLPLSFTSGSISHSFPRPMTDGFQSLKYFRYILKTEGGQALFKGVSPTLFGSIPTRAIFFGAYSQFKNVFGTVFPENSAGVFLCSAISAGAVTSTLTSPIWVVKTQMQLHNRPGHLLTVGNSVRSLYRSDGIRAFYRGLTASYAGSIETAIHFLIYEKMKLLTAKTFDKEAHPIQCMLIAAATKMTASMICYPHEVCRTRLRQGVHPAFREYHSFVQTLLKIWREEGRRGLYGGMTAHLIRVVPNTAIIFFSYEAIVRLLDRCHLAY